MIKRIKLARTLEIIAEQGDDPFYTGELSDLIIKEIQDNGGIITKEDLENYQIDVHEVLSINLNQSLTIFVSYPSSSGIILSFILNILRGFFLLKFLLF
jgi:gamma-glutamyltranspeptidase